MLFTPFWSVVRHVDGTQRHSASPIVAKNRSTRVARWTAASAGDRRSALAAHTLVGRIRVGIAVRATGVRIVCTRGAHVAWRAAAEFDAPDGVRGAIESVLRSLPSFHVRPRVVVALGPRWALTRRLATPIAATTLRMATTIIRSNPQTFFHHRAPLLIAESASGIDGVVWVAALAQSIVSDAVAALAASDLRLHAATTSVAALARGRTGAWRLIDGPDALVVESDRGRLRSVRRIDGGAGAAPRDGFNEAVDAARWRGSALAWRPGRGPRGR